MADSDNPGQFGNREDTEEQAKKGGEASTGKFGSPKGADPKKPVKKAPQHSRQKQNKKAAKTATKTIPIRSPRTYSTGR